MDCRIILNICQQDFSRIVCSCGWYYQPTLLMQLCPETLKMLFVKYGWESTGWVPRVCVGLPLVTLVAYCASFCVLNTFLFVMTFYSERFTLLEALQKCFNTIQLYRRAQKAFPINVFLEAAPYKFLITVFCNIEITQNLNVRGFLNPDHVQMN